MKKEIFVLALLVLAATAFATAPKSVISSIFLDTEGEKMFDFSTFRYTNDSAQADIILEPWDSPALCGAWIDMGAVQLESITAAPTTGYLSEEAGCDYIQEGHTYVVKTKDGKYAKIYTVNLTTTELPVGGYRNRATLEVRYQSDGTTNLMVGLPSDVVFPKICGILFAFPLLLAVGLALRR